jgi:predicted HTH transcriptional regulator
MKSLNARKGEPVIATFKATRLILSQTTETVKKKELNFLVIHRFGDYAGANGGGKTLLGVDNSSDIYIGFEYGFSDNFNIDFGRSKYEQLLDLGLKYNFLHQTTDNSSPVAMTAIVKTGFKPYHVNTTVFDNYGNRFSYLAQLL